MNNVLLRHVSCIVFSLPTGCALCLLNRNRIKQQQQVTTNCHIDVIWGVTMIISWLLMYTDRKIK